MSARFEDAIDRLRETHEEEVARLSRKPIYNESCKDAYEALRKKLKGCCENDPNVWDTPFVMGALEAYGEAVEMEVERIRKAEFHRGYQSGLMARDTDRWQEEQERVTAARKLSEMSLDTGSAIKKLAIAFDVDWNPDNAPASMAALQERIVHLLGGGQPTSGTVWQEWGREWQERVYKARQLTDECNFSGSKSYMDAKTDKPNPSETSEDANGNVISDTHSITDEIRTGGIYSFPSNIRTFTVEELTAIADRIDEQFARCCELWERTATDTAQEVHDSMEAECNELMEQQYELRQSLYEVAECLDLPNANKLHEYKIDFVTKLIVGAIGKLRKNVDEQLMDEVDRYVGRYEDVLELLRDAAKDYKALRTVCEVVSIMLIAEQNRKHTDNKRCGCVTE